MQTEKFSYDKVQQLCQSFTDEKGRSKKLMTEECKTYMGQYFYACNSGNHYVWDAQDNTFINYTKDQLKDVFLNRFPEAVKNWYLFQNTTIYKVVNKINKPRVYDDKINMFYGFKYPEVKPYANYPDEIKAKVEIFLTYVKEVLCSGNEVEYKHTLKWSRICAKGYKNESCLYFKGPEDIGKALLANFLPHGF